MNSPCGKQCFVGVLVLASLLEQVNKEEEEFEKQYSEWLSQYNTWKEQNKSKVNVLSNVNSGYHFVHFI